MVPKACPPTLPRPPRSMKGNMPPEDFAVVQSVGNDTFAQADALFNLIMCGREGRGDEGEGSRAGREKGGWYVTLRYITLRGGNTAPGINATRAVLAAGAPLPSKNCATARGGPATRWVSAGGTQRTQGGVPQLRAMRAVLLMPAVPPSPMQSWTKTKRSLTMMESGTSENTLPQARGGGSSGPAVP